MYQSNITMRNDTVTICRRKLPFHQQWRSSIIPLLEKAGYKVNQLDDGPFNLEANGILWILGAVNWFPNIYRQLKKIPKHERPFVVLWHAEPLPPPKISGLPWPILGARTIIKIIRRNEPNFDVYSNYFLLRQYVKKDIPDLLVVTTPGKREFLAEKDICAYWVPIGYNHLYGYDMGLTRDIDVVFLGETDNLRRKRLIKSLRERKVDLLAMGSWSDLAYWNENRTQLLNRTKIFLNLSRWRGDFASARFMLGMSNKTLLISEPVYNSKPFIPRKHFVSTTVKEMPGVINYYLSHDEERERIVNEAYKFITQEVTMERSISRIVELMRKCVNR